MTTADQIFTVATKRAHAASLPYSGALTPAEAYALLQQSSEALLVDVRTAAELAWVGKPLVDDSQYKHIEWTRYPGGVPNPDFLDSLRAAAGLDTPVFLLCRSAARSKSAAKAAAEVGFTQVYDILEGFEGDKDAEGHRKSVGGWCWRGLPWVGA